MVRTIDVINNGKGIRINDPDGLEINVQREDTYGFNEYVTDLAIQEGLSPSNNIQSSVGTNPSRIVVTWQ